MYCTLSLSAGAAAVRLLARQSACLRRSLFPFVRESDVGSSTRIVSHRASSFALMDPSAFRVDDEIGSSSSPQATESEAPTALHGSSHPSDVAVTVEQQPCLRCQTDSGKYGKHTCGKRRRSSSGPPASSVRSRRGSVAPTVHDQSTVSLTAPAEQFSAAEWQLTPPALASMNEQANGDDGSTSTYAGLTLMQPEQEAPMSQQAPWAWEAPSGEGVAETESAMLDARARRSVRRS